MEKKKKVAFDVDGVLVDFMSFIQKEGEKYLSSKTKENEISIDTTENTFQKMFNVDSKTEKDFFKKNLIKYFYSTDSIEFAADITESLKKENIEIHIVTSRYKCDENTITGYIMRKFLYMWLKKNEIQYDYINFCSIDNSATEKLKYCLNNNIDIIVEDTKENIELLSKYMKVLCIDEEHNKEVENKKVVRIYKRDFHKVYEGILNHFNIFIDYKFDRKTNDELQMLTKEELEKYYNELQKYYQKIPHLKSKKRNIDEQENKLSSIYKPASIIVNKYKKSIIYNEENLDTYGSNIYIANHISIFDSFKLIKEISKENRNTHLLTKKKQSNPLYEMLGCIEINDQDCLDVRNAIINMAHVLEHNGNIIIFPEGTRNKELKSNFENDLSLEEINQKLYNFRYGAFLLAKATKTNIIPVGISEHDEIQIFNIGTKIIEKDFNNHINLMEHSKDEVAKLIFDNKIRYRR